LKYPDDGPLELTLTVPLSWKIYLQSLN